MTRIGRCEVCDRSGRLNARICFTCQERFGRRVAELLARFRREPEFADACMAQISNELTGPGAVLSPDAVLEAHAILRKPAAPKPGLAKVRSLVTPLRKPNNGG